jgi:hypothetical protein
LPGFHTHPTHHRDIPITCLSHGRSSALSLRTGSGRWGWPWFSAWRGPGRLPTWHEPGQVFAAYLISFFTIGAVWVDHHALVANVAATTKLLAEYLPLGGPCPVRPGPLGVPGGNRLRFRQPAAGARRVRGDDFYYVFEQTPIWAKGRISALPDGIDNE